MLPAGESFLVVDERIVWCVPVILSLTSHGEVGSIDVDVETGQMGITPQLIAEINHRAETLALHPPSSTAA